MGLPAREVSGLPRPAGTAGYHVGFTRKGWGPGSLEGSGRTRNPAGPQFKDFETFFRAKPAGKPFCFWFGSTDPHRPYEAGSGLASGMNPRDVQVPPFLPDTPEVRSDISTTTSKCSVRPRGG